MITIEPAKVSAVLLSGAGWVAVTAGSFQIDTIQILPPPAVAPESEDYGFVFVDDAGVQVQGRMSALLAVKRAGR